MISTDATTSAMIVAEATSDTVQTGWDWISGEAQIVISNYLLSIVTILLLIIEVYKLIEINHQLKIIARLLAVIAKPLRARRIVAAARVRRINRQAARHVLTAPESLAHAETVHEQAETIEQDVVRNAGHF